MSPALNGSSALQRFKRSNASEIRNGIMFDFYPGLPHVCSKEQTWTCMNAIATQLHLLPFILLLPLPPHPFFFPPIFLFPSCPSHSSSPLSLLLSFLFTPPLPLSFLLSLLSPFHSSPELASRAPISCIRCHKLRTSDKFKCGRCGDIYLTKAVVTSGEGGGEEAALSQLSAWKRRKEARDSQENNSGAAVTLQGDSEGSGTFVISHSHICVGTIVAWYHTCLSRAHKNGRLE